MVLLLTVLVSVELTSYAGLWTVRKLKGYRYSPLLSELLDRHRDNIRRLIETRGGDVSSAQVIHDADLGWTRKPNARVRQVTSNSQGIRGQREYASEPAEGTTRLLAFGDSFTHGAGVPDDATWAARATSLMEGVEILNFGVGGFGIGQSFLRYGRRASEFHPHGVLIGFMSNNIQRTVSVFRPFLNNDTSLPLAKPRFIIDGGGELRLRANPLPTMAAYQRLLDDEATVLEELGEHDYFFQRMLSGRLDFLASVRLAKVARQMVLDTYSAGSIIRSGVYNVDSEAFAVTTRVLEAFYRQVENDGAAPLILVFPVSRDIDRKRAGRTASYRPLLDFCERQALRCVDFMDAFVRYGESREVADFLQSDGHYSRLGNEIVAQGLRDQLRDVPVPGPAR